MVLMIDKKKDENENLIKKATANDSCFDSTRIIGVKHWWFLDRLRNLIVNSVLQIWVSVVVKGGLVIRILHVSSMRMM